MPTAPEPATVERPDPVATPASPRRRGNPLTERTLLRDLQREQLDRMARDRLR